MKLFALFTTVAAQLLTADASESYVVLDYDSSMIRNMHGV